jgi:hypothetical protein
MRKLPCIAAALCLWLSSCSPRDFLTRRLASDLITASGTFAVPQQFWLRTGVMSGRDYSSPEYLVLQRHGWINSTSASCPPGLTPPPCWEVTLTPLGVDAFRDLIHGNDTAKQYFSVPTARRELVAITGISRSGNLAEVEFTWRWSPLNQVGAALNSGNVVYRSGVGFKLYDDGWRLMEGSAARGSPSMEDALKNSELVQ